MKIIRQAKVKKVKHPDYDYEMKEPVKRSLPYGTPKKKKNKKNAASEWHGQAHSGLITFLGDIEAIKRAYEKLSVNPNFSEEERRYYRDFSNHLSEVMSDNQSRIEAISEALKQHNENELRRYEDEAREKSGLP